MILEILKDAKGAIRGCDVVEFRKGEVRDVVDAELCAAAIAAGWAREAASKATAAVASSIEQLVAELRTNHTVDELREIYEAELGKKPSRKMHEKDLAMAIAEARRK